jgi:hypothetical protein
VVTGPEEVRRYDHGGGTGGNAPVEGRGDGRLGQLHVSRLDDVIATFPRPLADEGLVPVIGFLPPGAMIHNHHSDRLVAG